MPALLRNAASTSFGEGHASRARSQPASPRLAEQQLARKTSGRRSIFCQISETLAGRIAYDELDGLGVDEVGIDAAGRLWLLAASRDRSWHRPSRTRSNGDVDSPVRFSSVTSRQWACRFRR
jgi:hypothetical protein